MNRRGALIEAHRQAAAAIRQHVEAADGLADDHDEHSKIAAAMSGLADRHDIAVLRMTTTGSSPRKDRA